jgi:hypothetical protein
MCGVARWIGIDNSSPYRHSSERNIRYCDYGEMAERSKALDWNSSNIFTGVPGFESLSLRHFKDLVSRVTAAR